MAYKLHALLICLLWSSSPRLCPPGCLFPLDKVCVSLPLGRAVCTCFSSLTTMQPVACACCSWPSSSPSVWLGPMVSDFTRGPDPSTRLCPGLLDKRETSQLTPSFSGTPLYPASNLPRILHRDHRMSPQRSLCPPSWLWLPPEVGPSPVPSKAFQPLITLIIRKFLPLPKSGSVHAAYAYGFQGSIYSWQCLAKTPLISFFFLSFCHFLGHFRGTWRFPG